MGSESYFNWHESVKRYERESDRQIQSLLHQTRWLKKENEELCAQMSLAGLSKSQQPQTQRTTSRRTDKASFLGNVKFPFRSHTTRSDEEFLPAHQVQLDEGIDSTQVSTKKRRDRRLRLSNVIRAWLGP